ncbi:LPXTG cell wall anchor domain-containing protein [Paucilactobacillus nenjiangensis]|uniref:LPXTG cell wall anchor domain-containing protein n=1 Tax=Paucilactobacillus nenjiangensis TaxID=1296540 RepID=UPI0010F89264|nr:LPXTG cell wall anchor domain-containing protein [Paucilactobacillus nenjiangensis]
MKSRKLRNTVLFSGVVLGALALGVVTDTNNTTVFADVTTSVTSAVPENQTTKTTGINDTVDASTATDKDYDPINVGNAAKINPSQAMDENGQYTGVIEPRISDRENLDQMVTVIDAASLLNGDTAHYVEKQADGSFQVNSVTLKGGQEPAEVKSFNVDVSSVVSGDVVSLDATLDNGVKLQIRSSTLQDPAKYPNLVSGKTFHVYFIGQNMYDDIHNERVADDSTIGQSVFVGFVNSPLTFHYYNAEGKLSTGTLNLVNGEATPVNNQTTPPAETEKRTEPETPTDTEKPTEPETPTDAESTTAPTTVVTDEKQAVAEDGNKVLTTTTTKTDNAAKAAALPQTGDDMMTAMLTAVLGLFGLELFLSTSRKKYRFK